MEKTDHLTWADRRVNTLMRYAFLLMTALERIVTWRLVSCLCLATLIGLVIWVGDLKHLALAGLILVLVTIAGLRSWIHFKRK